MSRPICIALVGDRDESIPAHCAALEGFDAVWCVPGSPYRSHPFFVATLFQPERAVLARRAAPLVAAFIAAAAAAPARSR